jgi:hypothetical protein
VRKNVVPHTSFLESIEHFVEKSQLTLTLKVW